MESKVRYQSIGFGIAGLVLGVILAGYAANTNNQAMMNTMGMGRAHDMMNGVTMGGMVGALKGESGDDFDKTFIAMMIPHHEGAVEMAELAKKSAKHDEIKKMADDIISAQNREIEQMKGWYKDWYNTQVPDMMTNGHMGGQ